MYISVCFISYQDYMVILIIQGKHFNITKERLEPAKPQAKIPRTTTTNASLSHPPSDSTSVMSRVCM